MGNSFKVGDKVMWMMSTYIIIELVNGGAMLQQNFSINTNLTKPVNLDELRKI
jgi:hypothetical protein